MAILIKTIYAFFLTSEVSNFIVQNFLNFFKIQQEVYQEIVKSMHVVCDNVQLQLSGISSCVIVM